MKEPVCTKCLSPLTEENWVVNKSKKRGFRERCRKCHKEDVKDYRKKLKVNFPVKFKKQNRDVALRRILRNFGVTINEYEMLLLKQKGVCAICKEEERGKNLAVDHDHKTGRVRGLLCSRCNTVLGRVEDRVDLLKNMISYLQTQERMVL